MSHRKRKRYLSPINMRAELIGMWDSDGDPMICLYRPKGRTMRVTITGTDMDTWIALHNYVGAKLRECVKAQLAEVRNVRDSMASSWREVNAAITQEGPK